MPNWTGDDGVSHFPQKDEPSKPRRYKFPIPKSATRITIEFGNDVYMTRETGPYSRWSVWSRKRVRQGARVLGDELSLPAAWRMAEDAVERGE